MIIRQSFLTPNSAAKIPFRGQHIFFSFLLTFHLPDVTNKQCLERDRENCAHLVKDAKKSALENSIEYLHK